MRRKSRIEEARKALEELEEELIELGLEKHHSKVRVDRSQTCFKSGAR